MFISARARQTSFYLLGRHRGAMRQWLKKRLSELLYACARLKCKHMNFYSSSFGFSI